MKHLVKKWNSWRAGCSRPGCVASLEGGIVEQMTKKELNNYFLSNCPYVFNPKKRSMTQKETIAYLLKYAQKEIKKWNKLIDYWKDK